MADSPPTTRGLTGIAPSRFPGTSMLLAWTKRPAIQTAIDALTAHRSQPLVVRLDDPIDRGADLEAA